MKVLTLQDKDYTRFVENLIHNNKNMVVPWVLICGYCYYLYDESLISDHLFDKMMGMLSDTTIQHRHRGIIQEGHITAGTLCDLKEDDYPSIVVSVAHKLMFEVENNRRLRANSEGGL